MFNVEDVTQLVPGLEFEIVDVNGTPALLVPRERILEVARLLKEKFGFTQLIDVMGHDRNQRKQRFEVTYNLRNHITSKRVFLKTRCDERDPHVPSLCSVWTGCNWNEREVYDMYGVTFDGHPDMRRMYMPDDFQYYPLRKDFPLIGIPGSIPLPSHEGSDERFHIMERPEDLA